MERHVYRYRHLLSPPFSCLLTRVERSNAHAKEIAFQVAEKEGKRSGVAEVVSRISTDADGMSELIDTLAKVPGGETWSRCAFKLESDSQEAKTLFAGQSPASSFVRSG